MTLEQYLIKINSILETKVGLTIHDLPDFNFLDAHDDGISPKRVVALMLDNEIRH